MISVVCAVIINKGDILIAQRSEKMSLPLKWAFPGNKIEEDEDPKKALQREIQKELNLRIEIGKL